MNNLATIERISEILPHFNADKLLVAKVRGYNIIIPKDKYSVGDVVLLIHPDSILPSAPWAETFKKYAPKRIRAIKIRGEFSFGIIVSPNEVFSPEFIEDQFGDFSCSIGKEVGHLIGVQKYEQPQPQELNAKGNLPYGIFKTDEDRVQSLKNIPFGESTSISLKIDGQSSTFYCKKIGDEWQTGICSRSLEIKTDCSNRFTRVNEKYGILDKLLAFCQKHDKSLALRGEIYGDGVQNFPTNPHAKLPLDWACFSVLDLDTLQYHRKDSPFYFPLVCEELDLPAVPIVEKDVVLTQELVDKYTKLDDLNGQLFEGVVVNTAKTSFKILSLNYDQRK
jgi:RNA ligase (TIGR02306 family)